MWKLEVKSITKRPTALLSISRLWCSMAGLRENATCSSLRFMRRISTMRRRPEPPPFSVKKIGEEWDDPLCSDGCYGAATPEASIRSICLDTHGPSGSVASM